jgi:hypothetical protein
MQKQFRKSPILVGTIKYQNDIGSVIIDIGSLRNVPTISQSQI